MPAPALIGERILLSLWVGALWAIGFIAAPVLFALLDDRALAGSLAGEMFRAVAYLGLLCGSLLLAFQLLPPNRPRWRLWVLLGMLALVAIGQFVLAPMVAELRAAGLSAGPDFGRLHGIASTLYLLTSLAGLALVAFAKD